MKILDFSSANREEPDQRAPAGALWSGSALFAYVSTFVDNTHNGLILDAPCVTLVDGKTIHHSMKWYLHDSERETAIHVIF